MVVDPISTMFDLNNNYDKVRDHSLDMSAHRPRSPSMSSSECDEEYYVHVKQESDRMVEDKPVNSLGSFSLEYVTQEGQNNQVSKVADTTSNTRQQCAPTAGPALNHSPSENVVNIQLNYDPDQALDPESWDSNLHTVSLHRSMEHLASDVLNIKESLIRMQKYIAGKLIDGTKANEVKDLIGIGKALWEFISMVYESHWDALYTDDNNTSLRSKISLKFIPQVKNIPALGKSKDVAKLTFVLSIPPPILAKTLKEVREISKFFKKIGNSALKKSYAQASTSKQNSNVTSSNIVMNTLKIKEMFPNLPNKKIDSIQKVINSLNDKLKPRFNMTTKGPSHKQVIVPMSNNLGKRFTKDSSSHIININCALKNIKSNTCADFICADNKGVIISTNNVASNSNLHEIKKYAKNSLSANNDSIASPRLPQSKSYLKIVGILYFIDKSNTCVTSEDIECILKNNRIFNDIVLVSKPYIIKVSPKSDMVII